MVNRPKARGTAAETALVAYLRGHGYTATERRALSGGSDKGDISMPDLPWLAIEVKAGRTPRYPEWLREACVEAENAGAQVGVVVHKPMGVGLQSQQNWHVVMTMSTFMRLIDPRGISTEEN